MDETSARTFDILDDVYNVGAVEIVNGVTNPSSTGDSDYEYRKQNCYCLTSQRKPVASLKYMLTSWYSPETSLAISESISSAYSETELQQIMGCSRDILELSKKHLLDLRI